MNISRKHFIMLATVSLFTGMIAPAVAGVNVSRPYALTNMQYVAYSILVGITILFFLAHFRLRKILYIVTAALIVLILSLGVMTVTGMVKSFSHQVLQNFSWGWIFLLIGLVFLVLTFVRDDEQFLPSQKNDFSLVYEKILGIVGMITLTLLTAFIIFIAEQNSAKSTKSSALGNIFTTSELTTASGQLLSPSFQEIRNFSYNRSKNIFSFIATDKNGVTKAFPSKITIQNPENLASVRTIGERNFFVQNDGNVVENEKNIGRFISGENSQFLAFRSENRELHIVTDSGEQIFQTETETTDKIFYNSQTKDVFWREKIGDAHILFKNGKKLSDAYPSILRYSVAEDGSMMMIVEDQNFVKMVVKNGTVIHTIREEYVQGTLRMNAYNVLYAIKNTDDESFSLVMNGAILDRRLDEIREIFLEQNSSGFAYFGRPQGENRYCFFTRYRGNLCGLEKYMNPALEGDNSGIVFAAFREGRWSIYRNATELIRKSGYQNRADISYDYFFFDPTNFRHYVFIEKTENGYVINKRGKILETTWEDVDVNSIAFGYDTMFLVVKNADGWRILEF